MSYLEVLMKNDVPVEGNVKSVFVKCKEEDRIIVPSAHQTSEDNSDNDSTSSNKKTRKVFKKDFKKEFKTNKNALRKDGSTHKKWSKKSSKKSSNPRDSNYKVAFEKAQVKFIKECRPDSNGNAIISQSIEYIHNWQGYYVKVDLTEDNILITHEKKEYNFSKKRFASNKYFQNMVRDDYNTAYGNTYLRFFPTRDDENSYTIHVKAGRR